MTIAQILEKMIAYSGGNLHDINHLICVWTYAKTIGELEGLEQETQTTLEIAAITHDIACPLLHWCGPFFPIRGYRRSSGNGSPIWWAITIPTPALMDWTIRSCWKRTTL